MMKLKVDQIKKVIHMVLVMCPPKILSKSTQIYSKHSALICPTIHIIKTVCNFNIQIGMNKSFLAMI